MRKIIQILFVLCVSVTANAQTAMQISGQDCHGVSHDMFSELDAGKAVVVFFFMPSCTSCPPPAQKIQSMANNIMETHPGMITAYAMPYNNSATCTYTSSWVSTNSVPLYAPYDSGATQVAYYGGFGMPTVVLLGGKDHRVMFSTLSFTASDTTIMRDSILALLSLTGLKENIDLVSNLELYPSPAVDHVNVNLDLKTNAVLKMELTDMTGKQVAFLSEEKHHAGMVSMQVNTNNISSGNYIFRLTVNGKVLNRKITILHQN